MKIKISILVITGMLLAVACSAVASTEASAPQSPVNPPATETSIPNTPEVIQSTAEVSTSVALNALPTLVKETTAAGGNSISESGITLDDNNKTFKVKVGDSFLLNLGMDTYDWTVTVDNDSVLRMKMGVMVIKGAQGIYDALTPGTTVLSATGDPHCRQSKPACAAPSILFTVTLIVE